VVRLREGRIPGMTLRWGILGPGRIAPRIVRAVRASSRSTLTAVASRDAGRAATFAATHGIRHSFGSYEGLLASPDVDVVYIALPNHLHASWSVRALEAGKHVLCEKPLALTPEDVDAIAAAATRAGRMAAEAFMYLHHPQIRQAIAMARAGELGPLELVSASFSFFLTYPNDPRLDPKMGGGSLWDVGCYPVSFARRLADPDPDGGLPDVVHALARLDERGVDRTFLGQLRFPGGLLAQFDSGFAAPRREQLEIVGGEATLTLEAPFLPAPEGAPPSLIVRRGSEVTRIDVPTVDQYALEVADLEAAIMDGRMPHVSLAFSRGTIATLVALDGAARADARAAVGAGEGVQ
jgi:xylose dehydrogenase (NAD/NADP)